MHLSTPHIINTTAAKYTPIDFHCHSTYSDGALPVKDLLDLAKQNGGKFLALTDHDTVAGISEAKIHAQQIGLTLLGGVEISVTWEGNTLVHILGLNIDETNDKLVANLNTLQSARIMRGQKIAEKLSRIGIPGAFEGAMKYCSNPNALSRTHFNRFLVENGYAKPGKAFEKYLAPGKPGYVTQKWASLENALEWIIDSGGVAVIAHPARYKFTRSKLLRFIEEFKQCGGIGIEVVSSSHSTDDIISTAKIAHDTGLLASMGSDFHNREESFRRITLGVNLSLPSICTPIYSKFGIDLN